MASTTEIYMHSRDGKLFFVSARSESDSESEALATAQYVLNAMGAGKKCVVRVAPDEVESQVNMDTGLREYACFVRFSFED